MGITTAAFYKWRQQHGGMKVKLKEPEEENARLERMYANLSLVYEALKTLWQKKTLTPDEKDSLAEYMIREHKVSQRQALKVVSLPQSTFRYQKKPRRDEELITPLQQLVDKHLAIGFWKCYYLLNRKGFVWNQKRIYRMYIALKLNIRR